MILYQVTKKFEEISRQKTGECFSYDKKDYAAFDEEPSGKTIKYYGLANRVQGSAEMVLKSVKPPKISPDDRKVRVYLRAPDESSPWQVLTGGAVNGNISVRMEVDYLFDFKGLKIVGHETFGGKYKISEVISGASICVEPTKEEAIKRAKELLDTRMPDDYIKKIKAIAPYYGMRCLMTSAVNVVRDNTLIGNKRYIKQYNRRTRGKKFKFGRQTAEELQEVDK